MGIEESYRQTQQAHAARFSCMNAIVNRIGTRAITKLGGKDAELVAARMGKLVDHIRQQALTDKQHDDNKRITLESIGQHTWLEGDEYYDRAKFSRYIKTKDSKSRPNGGYI